MNFTNVGDYRDVEVVGKIIDLLHEFQGPLPMMFLEIKRIIGDLGEIKILLK